MTMSDDWKVLPITADDYKEWLLYKHYAHRIPSVSYAFGLYHGDTLEAVITFGMPPSPPLMKGIFGEDGDKYGYNDKILELNRLCANDGLPKNALSFLVSRALQSLPRPMCVVSFADSGMNHHGYIYQATNWIYTGLSVAMSDWVIEGREDKHRRHIKEEIDKYGGIEKAKEILGDKLFLKERSRKHRYFYFLGSRTDRRIMKMILKYPVCPYPKGDNIRYDASYQVHSNYILF